MARDAAARVSTPARLFNAPGDDGVTFEEALALTADMKLDSHNPLPIPTVKHKQDGDFHIVSVLRRLNGREFASMYRLGYPVRGCTCRSRNSKSVLIFLKNDYKTLPGVLRNKEEPDQP